MMLKLAILALAAAAHGSAYTFEEARGFLSTYCKACHVGKTAVGGFAVDRVGTAETLRGEARKWTRAALRVRNGEMPPKNSPMPPFDLRERFTAWVDESLRTEACAGGAVPGPSPIRRLNRSEYSATIRDLFDIHLEVGESLPADGAGGEGFDNAAETLFLSPLHSEKYIEAAKLATGFAAKEFKSRVKILIAKPGPGVSERQAARKILDEFLPKAFRRPAPPEEPAIYLALFEAARAQGQSFENAVWFAIRAALVSPKFLFRSEPPNPTTTARPLDDYSLASRLSYFLWGSMPDELLFDVAAAGKLQDPAVLKTLIQRMLRNDKSEVFARRFIEQWLHTRELSHDKAPDAKLFPAYAADEELRSDVRLQPVYFFRELLMRDLSLVNLLDSKHTIGTRNLEKHYGITLPLDKRNRAQPQWVELPEGSRRGGLLGMAAVLSVSSYPYRTSPVLRGAFVLDAILGTPPPPPPPDVPALDEPGSASQARTVRERLEQHRANAACAGCHARIDPLGFALENYDAIGRWRDTEADKPVDTSGELIDGTKVNGPDQLRSALLDRKDLFARNLVSKMLGYALGRGLTLTDACTVDAIVAQLKDNEYRAQTLIEGIVMSQPFRNQAGTPAVKETKKP